MTKKENCAGCGEPLRPDDDFMEDENGKKYHDWCYEVLEEDDEDEEDEDDDTDG